MRSMNDRMDLVEPHDAESGAYALLGLLDEARTRLRDAVAKIREAAADPEVFADDRFGKAMRTTYAERSAKVLDAGDDAGARLADLTRTMAHGFTGYIELDEGNAGSFGATT